MADRSMHLNWGQLFIYLCMVSARREHIFQFFHTILESKSLKLRPDSESFLVLVFSSCHLIQSCPKTIRIHLSGILPWIQKYPFIKVWFSNVDVDLCRYQCWNELFELFDYSNSWDRIVVFSIHIRSFSGFRILFELFE